MLEKFFDAVRQVPVSQTIIDKAVELRQSQKMSMGDAIIASTTLSENDILLTNNEDDFKDIEHLKIMALKDIVS